MWRIIGQPKAVALLETAFKLGSLAHAYLFVGPAHIGKKTLALNFAQAINCQDDKPPCGECRACQRVMEGKHVDVRTIALASDRNSTELKVKTEISIDLIKEIHHSASLPPYEGKGKVFIIDDAERLSEEAANCILKILEEPPPKVFFLLLTARERLLPPTVVSRCQRVELKPLSLGEIEAVLIQQWQIEPGQARFLARLSSGCFGLVVKALTDETFFPKRAEKITKMLNLLTASYEERFAYVAELAEQFEKNRKPVEELLDLWIRWWRDMLLLKAGFGDGITNLDFEATLIEVASNFSLSQIKSFLGSLMAVKEQLSKNANPRLVFDVLMLDLPHRKDFESV